MNELIERIFEDFTVDGQRVPVSFLRYEGKATTYIIYQQIGAEATLHADNDLVNYLASYDFDIYSKGNYMNVAEEIKAVLKENNFRWQPDRDSPDMFEEDTGYYHKTLNFAIERSN